MTNSILNAEQKVKAANMVLNEGMSRTAVGDYFGVSRKTISRAITGAVEASMEEGAETPEFEVGDRVQIAEGSEYYREGDPSNPVGVSGTVDSTYTYQSLPLGVQWDNGEHNAYRASDLVMAKGHHDGLAWEDCGCFDEVAEVIGYNQAVEELEKVVKFNPKDFSEEDPLISAFTWTGTPQGHEFWSHICAGIMPEGFTKDLGERVERMLEDEDAEDAFDKRAEQMLEDEDAPSPEYYFVATQDSITVICVDDVGGTAITRNLNKHSTLFEPIRAILSIDQSPTTLAHVYKMIDPIACIEAFSVGRVKVDAQAEAVVFVKADGTTREVPEDIAGDIITTVREYGRDRGESLVKFLDKLMDNPSFSAIEGLYRFMRHNCIGISEEGDIAAWKGVNDDLYDIRTGTIYNGHLDKEIRVDRSEVDDNTDNTCSYGLHVGSKEYATMWGNRLLAVTLNPKDVVAVPKDYDGAKMRCCAYTPKYAL